MTEAERYQTKKSLKEDAQTANIPPLSLETYALYADPKYKPAPNYNALRDATYKDFCDGEGQYSQLYLDYKGNPTIGIGRLVAPIEAIKGTTSKNKDEATRCKEVLARWKEEYKALPLKRNGKPLTPTQKSAEFDAICNAIRSNKIKTKPIPNAGELVTWPNTGRLDSAGIKATFYKDFDYWYNQTKKKIPYIDKCLLPVQLATMHAAFAGQLKAINKDDIGRRENQAALVLRVNAVRNKSGTSAAERKTCEEAWNAVLKSEQNFYNAHLEKTHLLVNEHQEEILASYKPDFNLKNSELTTLPLPTPEEINNKSADFRPDVYYGRKSRGR